MARRTQPYLAVEPVGSLPQQGIAPVVGSAPTLSTRRRYGTGAMFGLLFVGNKRAYVPLQSPWAGQGATYPAFPLAQPSKVAPNAIRPALFVALNLFSPSGHSNPLSAQVPPPAELPLAKLPTPQAGRRPSGNFTIPHPLTTPQYDTSRQWILSRLGR